MISAIIGTISNDEHERDKTRRFGSSVDSLHSPT